MSAPKPVVLCILDGWGLREEEAANAPKLADTPTMDRLVATCPHATLVTHGPDVGLPEGQTNLSHTFFKPIHDVFAWFMGSEKHLIRHMEFPFGHSLVGVAVA